MENSTTAIKEIHFRDARPPQEILFELERKLMVLMQPFQDNGHLAYRAVAKLGQSVPYRLLFGLEAALPKVRCYRFRMEVSWAVTSAEYYEYFRESSAAWFAYWTEDFKPAKAPRDGEGSAERYRALVEQALGAEAHLMSVPALQKEIITAMHGGAWFRTAHKEGGTTIAFTDGRFSRQDYGESDTHQVFPDEPTFLKLLRQFFHMEVSRNVAEEKVTEYAAWKLLLRLMQRP